MSAYGQPFSLLLSREQMGSDIKLVKKFGFNPAVGTTEEDIVAFGGVYPWQASAFSLEILSDNANDTAAGSGARTVSITGLDENWEEQIVTVSLNGTSAVAIDGSWMHVNTAQVVTCGTAFDSNTGDLTIRLASGGDTQASIVAGRGRTQLSNYTVPAGWTAYLLRERISVDSNSRIDFRGYRRTNDDESSAPYAARQIFQNHSGLRESQDFAHDVYFSFPEKTDIWYAGAAVSGTSGVSVSYDLILVR